MDKTQVKALWNERPLEVLGVASGAVLAVAKMIDVLSSVKSRRAYAKQVNRKSAKRS